MITLTVNGVTQHKCAFHGLQDVSLECYYGMRDAIATCWDLDKCVLYAKFVCANVKIVVCSL